MKCSPELQNRLKRAQGQMAGVLSMMEDERSCNDVVTQLSAIRSSIDKTIALMTTENLMNNIEERYCIEIDEVDEAVDLLLRSK
jgi:CsoR family transcriptional regulator, copper-sensing transcriptional repressor